MLLHTEKQWEFSAVEKSHKDLDGEGDKLESKSTYFERDRLSLLRDLDLLRLGGGSGERVRERLLGDLLRGERDLRLGGVLDRER